MDPLVQQILDLLTTQEGSLAYHLVLAFSILGALQLCLSQRGFPQLRRTTFGLGLLLILQLSLFVVSGLGWQGLIAADRWLPLIDRAVFVLGLVVIVWMWAFPEPSPLADSAALLLGLLAITGAVLGGLWWLQQDAQAAFNRTLFDTIAQVSALVVALLGVLLLVIRRPPGWVMGMYMLLFCGAGVALYLLLPVGAGDYAGVVRLAQIAAFPFLWALPLRFAMPLAEGEASAVASAPTMRLAGAAQARLSENPAVWQSLLQLVQLDEPGAVSAEIVSALARLAQADLCLLCLPPDAEGKLVVSSAYDLRKDRRLENTQLDSRSLPMLITALRMGRVRRLTPRGTLPDLVSLARAFDFEKLDSVLFLPVLSSGGQPASAVILASASGVDWNSEDQSFLAMLARLLVQFLHRTQEAAGWRGEIDQAHKARRTAQRLAQQSGEERQKLLDQLAVLREDLEQSHSELEGMAKLTAAHVLAQEILTKLQAEHEALEDEMRQAAEAAAAQEKSYEAEIRLALEEVASLNSSLADADRKVSMMKASQPGAALSNEQLETILVISQDLRQPLSSVVGYTDFLLSEAVGILGVQQRKHLERIKVSTERMGRLVDDLIQIASLEGNVSKLTLEEVDLGKVIQDAVGETKRQIMQKDIQLRLDLPEAPLHLSTDQRALRKVFSSLLNNAVQVTSPGGNVRLLARKESTDGEEDYVLVQVIDSGGGIALTDLPMIFSHRSPDAPIQGIGNGGVDLPGTKTLIEVMGGRTWVDSEPGQGAVFSVLLPIAPFVDGGAE